MTNNFKYIMIKKILIVDDNINLRDSLKRSLKSLKIEITCASSAEDAMNLLNLNEIGFSN